MEPPTPYVLEPEFKYAAFISYSRSETGSLAGDLQSSVERFAKKWNQVRAVRVFRDDNAMSANSSLWGAIEAALGSSQWLVVLLHPATAASEYVAEEIKWWLQHKGTTPAKAAERVLLVLAGGDLVWDKPHRRFDIAASSALPPVLAEAYAAEPRWIDMRWHSGSSAADPRFQDAVADIAAAVRDLSKEEVVGENVRQHRRTRVLARSAIAALVGLLILAIGATGVAITQRDRAVQNAIVAESNFLAVRSGQLLPHDANAARQLAAQAYLRHSSSVTEDALFTSLLDTGEVSQLATVSSPVRVIIGAQEGTRAFAGLEDGSVYGVTAQSAVLLGRLPSSIVALSTDKRGTVVAALSDDGSATGVAAWSAEGAEFALPSIVGASEIHVLPDGQQMLVGTAGEDGWGVAGGTLIDLASGNTTLVDAVGIPVGENAVLARPGGSQWAVHDLRTGQELRSSEYGFGNRRWLVSSPSGRHVGMAGGTQVVPIWSTEESTDNSGAECPVNNSACDLWSWDGGFPDGFARGPDGGDFVISASGQHLAWYQGTRLSRSTVIEPAKIEHLDTETQEMVGLPPVTAMAFLGRDIIAGTTDGLLRIDFDAESPVRHSVKTNLHAACTACDLRPVTLSPDSQWLAYGFRQAGLTIADLETGEAHRMEGSDLHPIAWTDHDVVAVVDLEKSELLSVAVNDGLRVVDSITIRGLDNLSAGGGIAGGTLTTEGAVRFVTEAGQIWTLEPGSGTPSRPLDVPGIADRLLTTRPLFSPDGAWAVVGDTLIDLVHGETRAFTDSRDALLLVDYDGVIVLHADDIARYSHDGTLRSTTPISGTPAQAAGVAPSGRWVVSADVGGDSLTIRNMSDGGSIGTISLGPSSMGQVQVLFDQRGDAVVLHTSSPEDTATAEVLILSPEAWLEAMCSAPDFAALSVDQWTNLTQLPLDEDDICNPS